MRHTRRTCTILFVVLLMSTTLSSALAKQDTANPFADLGLPEIAVTITDTAIEGAPADVPAGRYVLAVTSEATSDDPATGTTGVGFLQPADDMSAADFVAFIAGMAEEMPGGSEMDAGPDATPMADEAMMGPPLWYYEVPLAGGVYAKKGQTAYTVLDLTAGEWVLWAEDPTAPQAPVTVNVTGEAPADQPTPEATTTIAMAEMAFTLDQPLQSGFQVIALTNAGAQPHFLGLARVPTGTAVDDVLQLSETYMNPQATPPAGLTFSDITPVYDSADLSSGMTNWFSVDLAPGDYLLVCFVPDQETGIPHAMLGMIDVVTVE